MDTDNITYMNVTLEDMTYFWTKSGVPCFMANRDNIEEEIEFLGFNIYYLICNVAQDRKVETKEWIGGKQETKTTYVTDLSTKIVKVVNNFVGRSVSEVNEEDLYDFDVVREAAEYNLPPIPHVIVQKLDEFFRLVDAQHGTESIVLLTFDPKFEGSSEGWGVLVPDQVNTSVHCKYDADSIVDQKPEDVLIVGSVHSHPNMAAYASGTDHADQADFDGLHITYGWQKSVNGGATQYHIELQMAGTAYTLKPEDVFEDLVLTKEPDPDVLEWSSKVKKVSPPQGGSATHQQAHTPSTKTPAQSPLLQGSTPRGTNVVGDPRLQNYPDPKDDNPFLVVGEVDPAGSECPSCGSEVLSYAQGFFYCDTCDLCLALSSDSYSEIIDNAASYLKVRKMNLNSTIYLWTKDGQDQDLLMRIKETDYIDDEDYLHTSLLTSSDSLIDQNYYDGFDVTRTACCDTPIHLVNDCNCPVTVYYDDVVLFDQEHPYNVYASRSSCEDCEYYYSRNCLPYLTAIIDFAKTKRVIESPIQECHNYVPYQRLNATYYD